MRAFVIESYCYCSKIDSNRQIDHRFLRSWLTRPVITLVCWTTPLIIACQYLIGFERGEKHAVFTDKVWKWTQNYVSVLLLLWLQTSLRERSIDCRMFFYWKVEWNLFARFVLRSLVCYASKELIMNKYLETHYTTSMRLMKILLH